MDKVHDVHQREAVYVMRWSELERLIKDKMIEECGFTKSASAVVIIKQMSEGSPSYLIDKWEVMVTIVEKL